MSGLILHIDPDVGALADRLADVLAGSREDPFVTDLVCVPGAGAQRWLAQQMSLSLGTDQQDGVCARVRFSSVERFATSLARDAGIVADPDPWQADALVPTLMSLMADVGDEAWFAPVQLHLGQAGARPRRRWSVARAVARRFTWYTRWFEDMIRAWGAGGDVGVDGAQLPAASTWEPPLWRELVARIDGPDPVTAGDLLCAAAGSPGLLDPDTRVAVFDPGTTSSARLRLVAALAAHRDVHVMIPGSVSEPTRLGRRLGAQGRATLAAFLALADEVRTDRPTGVVASAASPHSGTPEDPGSRDGWAPGGTPSPRPSGAPSTLATLKTLLDHTDTPSFHGYDDTVRLHASHGPDRQVEVLREVLLGLLSDDPTLQPRDIAVICPQLDTFGPLVQAMLGDRDDASHVGHRLRVRVTDRSPRHDNPLMDVAIALLRLSTSRARASELLDLCSLAPVAARFGFSDDDQADIARLIEGSGIRWGMTAAGRAPFGMEAFAQNTWQAGLNRLVAGAVLPERELAIVKTTLPMEAITSGQVRLIGSLAELDSRVRHSVETFRVPTTLRDWVARIRAALTAVTVVRAEDSWQVAHAWGVLAELADQETGPGCDLDVADITALLEDELAARVPRSTLLTGDLTVTGVSDLRGVPHRVIVLLGLDSETFPRAERIDGNDVTAGHRPSGIPDPTADDRQLLVDAVRAAQERLVLIYRGRDPQRNDEVAAPLPIQDLLAALDAVPGATPSAAALTLTHPALPFSPDAAGGPVRTTFDAGCVEASAIVARAEPTPPPLLLAGPLPELPVREVRLDDLVALYTRPVAALLRQRARVSLRDRADEPDPDEIPVTWNALDTWHSRNRILTLLQDGHSLADAQGAEWRRGTAPPLRLGTELLSKVGHEAMEIHRNAEDLQAPIERIGIDLDLTRQARRLPRLVGTVSVRGDAIVRVVAGRINPGHRIDAWIQLLALATAHPERVWRAQLIGHKDSAALRSPDTAPAQLAYILDRYLTGLTGPLPLPPLLAYAAADGADRQTLSRRWSNVDALTQRTFDGLDALLAIPARADDHPSGAGLHRSRFDVLTWAIYTPLVQAGHRS